MTAARAKRRLIAWARYYLRYPAGPGGNFHGTHVHRGHVRAYNDVAFGGRPSPHGIRAPWDVSARHVAR